MKSKSKFFVLISITFLSLLALTQNSRQISANVAAPSQGGRITGEPNGLEKIYIRHESLTIDFRDLARENSPQKIAVEALYEIENTGADKRLDLVFVLATAEVSEFSFFLDETPVAVEMKNFQGLPESWQKPEKTKWLNGTELMYDPAGYNSGQPLKDAAVSLTIPKGSHKLRAAYKADPTKYYGYAPKLLYQFAYILAPAKDWAGFKSLDVKVHIPAGWQIVTDPELEQNGEILTRHFDNIPADAITFTLERTLPAGYYHLKDFLGVTLLLGLFGFPVLILFLSIRKAWRGNLLNPAMGYCGV